MINLDNNEIGMTVICIPILGHFLVRSQNVGQEFPVDLKDTNHNHNSLWKLTDYHEHAGKKVAANYDIELA